MRLANPFNAVIVLCIINVTSEFGLGDKHEVKRGTSNYKELK